MSQYVILVETAPLLVNPTRLYALTTSSHPPTGLELLQNYSPVSLTLIHAIQAGHRTDYLKQTLDIKYRSAHLYSFWYALTPADIAFIKSISDDNFQNMIGFIHRQLKPPDMTPEETQALLQRQLDKAADLLKTDPLNL